MKPITDPEFSILNVILALHEQAYTENLFQNVFTVPGLSARGDVYRHVDALEEAGLIASKLVVGDRSAKIPTRRYYKLTGEGKRVLESASQRGQQAAAVGVELGDVPLPSII